MPDTIQNPPPSGDPKKAEKYLSALIDLIQSDKVTAVHSDLKKFDPTSLEDHYRVPLKEYDVEISHSKQPNTGKNSYIMLFTNTKHLVEGSSQKAILAYIHLSEEQFMKIKYITENQIQRKIKEAEEKRFNAAMEPVDEIIQQLISEEFTLKETQEKNQPTPSRDDILANQY